MGDVAVKIKGNKITYEIGGNTTCQTDSRVTCKIGKPKFECKIQGVVIQGVTNIEGFLIDLPEYPNETEAIAALGPNKLYWISTGTDTEFPNTLKRTPA
jgi:hypothetical protein